MAKGGGLRSPMTTLPKDGGKMATSHHGQLALPVKHEALKQKQTATAVGIQFRTGEVKPGEGGNSKIRTPMHDHEPNFDSMQERAKNKGGRS